MALIGEMHYLTIGGNTYAIPTSGGSTVSVTRALTSGTKTATISVDGTSYDLYAPTPNAGTITSVKTTAGAHTTINVSSGAANFNVPTKTSHLTNDSGFLTSSDIASVMKYKGTKATVSALPTSGNTTGDVWHVTADGSEWAWDGSAWQELGTAIDLSGYAQLTGASFTGPVTFGDSVTADELTTGDLVVTGAASFTNNIAANTINGVAVGNSPKFTDTVTTVTTTGSGNAVTAISATDGVLTVTKGATYVTSSGVTSITLTQGTGISIGSSGTAITSTGSRTISLATITKSDTTSTASPAHGGTFTAVDSITYDTYGRVTGVNTKTITLPADNNTHNTAYLYAGASNGTANAATTNGNTYLILMDGGSATTRRKISGSTNVSVASDSSGNITITGPNLSGYALSSAIPTKTSQLTNDSEFITTADIPDGASAYTGTPSAVSTTADKGTSTAFARGDHVHNITSSTITSALGYTPYNSTNPNGYITASHTSTYSLPLAASGTRGGVQIGYSESGTNYAVKLSSEKMYVTVPWTDTKLQVAEVTSTNTYYPIVGNGTTASTRNFDTTGFIYVPTTGTTSATGKAELMLGNNKTSTTAGNKQGQLIIYGSTAYAHTISGAPTAARTLTLPDKTGTIALTSDITDSDEKLKIAAVTSGTTYYPIVAANSTTAANRQYDSTGFVYKGTNGTTSAVGSAQLTLGNSTASGTANNKQGQLIMYGSNAKKATITLAAPSADIELALPTTGGTLALATQIPSSTGSSTTGITATTTATKTTLGTASSIYGVKSGTNSTTTASKASGGNGSAPSLSYTARTVGSASGWSAGSATVTNHVLSFTAPTLTITDTACDDITSWSAGSASTWSFSDITVPIRADSATSVPNVSTASATVSISDPGHTHSI